MKAQLLLFGFLVLSGLGLIAGGVSNIHQKRSGRRVRATVTSCQLESSSTHPVEICSGTWVVGGSLLGNGRVVIGNIDATSSQIGKTIYARVSGGNAYTSSLAVPVVLIVMGLLMAALGIFLVIVIALPSRRAPTPTLQPPAS